MRNFKRSKGINDKSLTKEISGLTREGEKLVLGQFHGQYLSLLDSVWSLKLQNSNDNKDSEFLLTGPRMVKLVPGRKLDYEPKHHDKRTNCWLNQTRTFTGFLPLQEEWFALVGIVLALIASKHFQKGKI